MKKIKVGAVSYLNTKPLIYGFQQGKMGNLVDLVTDYPSRIAGMLLQDEIDVGLVPVAIIPNMPESYIISDYCIGCNGEVASVCLFSDVPIDQVETVLLDYQSRTSARLARILLKEYWKKMVVITDAKEDFRNHIRGTTAGVIIGDRALEQRKSSKYLYDFGAAWKDLTGLPFVFAAWISNKKLDPDFIIDFNATTQLGLNHLEDIIAQNPYTIFDLHDYFTKFMSYHLDSEKRKGMSEFLRKIGQYRL